MRIDPVPTERERVVLNRVPTGIAIWTGIVACSEVVLWWMVDAAMSALHPNGILASRVTFFRNTGFAEVFWV